MSPKTTEAGTARSARPTFVRFSAEVHDVLEDLRYHRQRAERRHVTKRELLEEAVHLLLAAQSNTKNNR
jgi:transcriptional regulator of met regulon